MNARPPVPVSALQVVRMGLVLGVLLFGIVTYVFRHSGDQPVVDQQVVTMLRYALLGLVVVALAGILFLRSAQANAATFEKRAGLAIAGWSMGEAPALFGGVYYFVSGNLAGYLLGFAILLVAIALIPLPSSDDRSY